MSVTVAHITPTDDDVFGHHPVTFLKVTLDASYAGSGGEALDLRPYATGIGGNSNPVFVGISPEGATAEGYVWAYDYANRKIIAFENKNPAAAGGADIALPEVTATNDLSSVDLRLMVIF